MSAPALFDPLGGPPGGWPQGAEAERAYLEAFARSGSRAFITNLRTTVLGLKAGPRILPVTVNEAEYGDSYVCLPHTAYALYAKDELHLVDVGGWQPALAALASIAGAALRSARVNRIVQIDNWMLSTNLHGDLSDCDIDGVRRLLTDRYPDHMIAMRCLDAWSDAPLLQRFREAGWRLLPSRQIWRLDDVAREWRPRRDSRRDLALLDRSAHMIDEMAELHPGDARRIADLYAMLYLDRYSRLNPAFTEAYVELTHRGRILAYSGLRDASGRLAGVAGCFIRGGVLTTPIVGYDTSRPASEGLYRMTSALFARIAEARGLRLNASAGAASFKRNRGARPTLEYCAYYVDHLSAWRRGVIAAAETALNRMAAPLLEKRGL